MANRIEGNAKGTELDKRTYLYGVKVFSECSKCKTEFEYDLGFDYLSYPVVGEPSRVHFYCEDCDEYWDIAVVLEVNLRLA
jgi:hypothetical protein